MIQNHPQSESLMEKIRGLPPQRIREVEDFVDFLRRRDDEQTLTQSATMLSEAVFTKVWDNPEDAVYDDL